MKPLFKTFLIGIVLFMSFTAIQAQTDYGWDYYGVGFGVARDFQVYKNSAEAFEAQSSDRLVWINIQPWSDASITEENLYSSVLNLAYNIGYYDGGEVAGDYIQINDFSGYFIVCAPNDPNTYNYFIVALLLDTLSDTNLVVSIGYQEGNFEEAQSMLLSFYAYD